MTDIITTQDRASQALSRIGQLAASTRRSEGADFLLAVRADYDVVADALATLAELRGKLEGTEACYQRAKAEADELRRHPMRVLVSSGPEPTTAEIREQAAAMWGTGWGNNYVPDGDVAARFAWARAALIGGATT
jgi:hypothetical protein